MKGVLLAALLVQLAPRGDVQVTPRDDAQLVPRGDASRADSHRLAYMRSVTLPTGVHADAAQACALLDAQVFPHAAPALKDLRLFSTGGGVSGTSPQEIPYAITLSQTVSEDTQPARVLNLGAGAGGSVVFDLQMPDRPYTDVELDLAGHDFLATAVVSGRYELEPGHARTTGLGTFTLFDLAAQHLSRDTTLPLQESTFRYLHVELRFAPAPGTSRTASFTPAVMRGAQVPPSRQAQVLYTTVERVSAVTTGRLTSPRRTRFDITLPLRVPVERILFDLPAGYKGDFSRDVEVNARPEPSAADSSASSLPPETIRGTISRVHVSQGGRAIDEQRLSVAATLGANLQTPAHVWVEIDSGDDQPLPITAVRLEMRQRKLCFDQPGGGVDDPGGGLALEYGDPTLFAPVYDYARLFTPSSVAEVARLGPEMRNPLYVAAPVELRPFSERHPEVLWITLLLVICALGAVALRSSRRIGA